MGDRHHKLAPESDVLALSTFESLQIGVSPGERLRSRPEGNREDSKGAGLDFPTQGWDGGNLDWNCAEQEAEGEERGGHVKEDLTADFPPVILGRQ